MNIPTFDNVCKYEDAHDTFYDALEYLSDLPWLGGLTSLWVSVTILALVEKAGEQDKKAMVWMKLPEGNFTVFEFRPLSLTAITYNSETVDIEGAVFSDELNDKLVVNGWSNCDYHNQTPPELEVIEGGVED
jgi:hypothetical protein